MRGGKRPNAGNKKGNKHSRTLLWEEFGKAVLSEGLGKALDELNNLKGEKYLYHYEKFLSFFKARPNRVEISTEPNPSQRIPPDELDETINNLYHKVMNHHGN